MGLLGDEARDYLYFLCSSSEWHTMSASKSSGSKLGERWPPQEEPDEPVGLLGDAVVARDRQHDEAAAVEDAGW